MRLYSLQLNWGGDLNNHSDEDCLYLNVYVPETQIEVFNIFDIHNIYSVYYPGPPPSDGLDPRRGVQRGLRQ